LRGAGGELVDQVDLLDQPACALGERVEALSGAVLGVVAFGGVSQTFLLNRSILHQGGTVALVGMHGIGQIDEGIFERLLGFCGHCFDV